MTSGDRGTSRSGEYPAKAARNDSRQVPNTSIRRIAIVGPSGSGKSTVACQLGELLGLPVVHLDTLFWQSGWVLVAPEECARRVYEVVEQPSWIIDGNYRDTLDVRLEAADLVILLDLPRRVYLRRVVTRLMRYRGRVRPDMAEGCPERLDVGFLKWVWDYEKKRRPNMLERLESANTDGKLVVLRNDIEIAAFLEAIEASNG